MITVACLKCIYDGSRVSARDLLGPGPVSSMSTIFGMFSSICILVNKYGNKNEQGASK